MLKQQESINREWARNSHCNLQNLTRNIADTAYRTSYIYKVNKRCKPVKNGKLLKKIKVLLIQ